MVNTTSNKIVPKVASRFAFAVLTALAIFTSESFAEQETVLELEHSADLKSWESISLVGAIIEEDGTIRIPQADPAMFYRLKISNSEVPDRFAPEDIADTTLSLTIETSTAAHVTPGDVDTFRWNANGTFLAGEDTEIGNAFYSYARLSNVSGKITFTVIENGNASTGVITLLFTSLTSGTFELNEGDLRETGTFSLN